MMNYYKYNGVIHTDEQLYSLENQIKDELEKAQAGKPNKEQTDEENTEPEKTDEQTQNQDLAE